MEGLLLSQHASIINALLLLAFATNGIYSLPSMPGSGCSYPDQPSNGQYRLSDDNIHAYFDCNQGYYLVGYSTLTCTFDRWTQDIPICVSRGCEQLSALEHGFTTISYGGALVSFRCIDHYELKGSSVLMCDGMKWNSTQPYCVDPREEDTHPQNHKRKHHISARKHADRSGGGRKTHEDWMSESDYSCIGHHKVVAPPSVLNAVATTKWDVVDDVPRLYSVYRCKWGYTKPSPNNEYIMYCQKRSWVGNQPKCRFTGLPTTTQDPFSSLQDQPDPRTATHEDWLRYADYSCFDSYHHVTAPEIPHADRTPRHRRMDGLPHLFVEYQCQEGYEKTRGSGYLYCRQKQWLGDQPMCQPSRVFVSKDGCDVNNGGCAHKCTSQGMEVQCLCNVGYMLGHDGKSCEDIDECAISNGGCAQTCKNTAGSSICSCQRGFRLNQDRRTCEHTSQRDGIPEVPPLVLFHSK